MSIATGGIDSQIQDKMDTYRSNPQALQKAVGVTKQTVDVMALQKLISEKNEKAKALMAEAEQNPKTIAEQRQEEAIAQIQQEQSRSLGELTQQTAGTLNNKAAMQKKNMNRMAQNAGKPKMGGGAGLAGLMGGRPPQQRRPMPPQGGPQAAGLPNARMMQAAQSGPVRRMAGGGIVGFAEGEGVKKRPLTDVQKEAFRAKFGPSADRLIGLVESGVGVDSLRMLGDQAEVAEILGDSAPQGILESMKGLFGGDGGGFDPSNIATAKNQFKDETPVKVVPEYKTGIATPTDTSFSDPSDTSFSDPYAENSVADPKTGGITQIIEEKPTLPPTTTSGDLLESTEIMGTVNDISSDAALSKGTAFADDYLKRDESNRSFEDMKAELQTFDSENYGEYEDINSFLIGTGGTGSIGAAAKGGKRAMDRSVRNRRNRLQDNFSLEKDRLSADSELGRAGLQLGMALAQDAAANERNIRTNSTNMSIQDQRTALGNAKIISDENKARLTSADNALDRQVSIMQVANQTMQIKQTSALEIMNIISATRDALTLKEETNGAYAKDLAKAIDGFEKAKKGKTKDAFEKDIAAIQAKISLAVNAAMDAGISGNEFTMLEIESEAKKVFVNTLRAPTGGKVISVR